MKFKIIPLYIILLTISLVFLILPFLNIKVNDTQGSFSANILFVVDVSKSMNTGDILENGKSISRLTATKKVVNTFISERKEFSYGLMVFAGESVELLPFTNDLSIFKTLFLGIDENNVSKYGTNFEEMFRGVITFFTGYKEEGTVVIFTDGGDEINSIQDTKVLEGLEKQDKNIIIVGIGTEVGGKIPIGKDAFGKTVYKKYAGKEVISKLDDSTLKDFSNKYNFEYLHFENIEDFETIEELIAENIIPINREGNIVQRNITREFVILSFIFFILSLLCEYRKKLVK